MWQDDRLFPERDESYKARGEERVYTLLNKKTSVHRYIIFSYIYVCINMHIRTDVRECIDIRIR